MAPVYSSQSYKTLWIEREPPADGKKRKVVSHDIGAKRDETPENQNSFAI
jgi:hypothetical protein